MAILKCKMCGGELKLNKSDGIATCEYCGTQQIVFYVDDSKSPQSRFSIIQKPDFFVSIKELVQTEEFANSESNLLVCLGKDYKGKPLYADFDALQHILVTGASGYGKTNCLTSIAYSIIKKAAPEETKLMIIDPKGVNFSGFDGLPHLLVPVVTDTRKAVGALGWAVAESRSRLQKFSDVGVKDINTYNKYVDLHSELYRMPSLVIVIDDFYQVLYTDNKEVESSVLQLIQYGRTVGIHLVVSSLQADRKFLPDRIKNSIPTKISFVLRTKAESKYIFDRSCAEKLSTVGDMIYFPIGETTIQQIKCCYVEDADIEEQKHRWGVYNSSIEEIDKLLSTEKIEEKIDPLYNEAVSIVVTNMRASTSFLQRKLGIGYSRASNIMDALETNGVIGPQIGSLPREVLVSKPNDDHSELSNVIDTPNVSEPAPAPSAKAIERRSQIDNLVLGKNTIRCMMQTIISLLEIVFFIIAMNVKIESDFTTFFGIYTLIELIITTVLLKKYSFVWKNRPKQKSLACFLMQFITFGLFGIIVGFIDSIKYCKMDFKNSK